MSDGNQKIQMIARVVNFLNTTSGRDKSCRFVQYFPKVIKGAIRQMNGQNIQKFKQYDGLFQRLDIISGQCSMTRKILRFFRQISICKEIIRLISAFNSKKYNSQDLETNKFYVISKVLGDLSLALFFLFDHFIWICRTKLVNNDNLMKTSDYLSNLFWLFECIFTIIYRVISLNLKNKEMKALILEDKDNSQQIQKQSYMIDQEVIDIARSAIDIPVAIGFMKSGFISDGLIGVLGTVTSVIGCYQNFK